MSDDDEDVLQRRAGDDDESVLLPAFINKLLKMLADPECSDTIQYGSDGTTLLVVDSSLFATVVSPLLSPFSFPCVLNHFSVSRKYYHDFSSIATLPLSYGS